MFKQLEVWGQDRKTADLATHRMANLADAVKESDRPACVADMATKSGKRTIAGRG